MRESRGRRASAHVFLITPEGNPALQEAQQKIAERVHEVLGEGDVRLLVLLPSAR